MMVLASGGILISTMLLTLIADSPGDVHWSAYALIGAGLVSACLSPVFPCAV